jgi:NitT/TauT family transport system substrate-binding protein
MNSQETLTRRQVVGAGAGLGAVAAAGSFLSIPAIAADRAVVNMQLGWLVDGMQIGQVVAKKLGFYEEEGIEFSLVPGGPNIDGIALVASGRSPLGLVNSSPPVMLAVSQGIPITCFAAGLQQHPWVLCSLPKKPVRTPAEMRGKRLGIQPTSMVLVKAMLRKNQIAEKDVEIIPVGSDLTPLLSGQVDAFSGWQTNAVALKVLGKDRIDLRLWDAGVRLYANCFYAPTQTVRTSANVLQRFLRATSRGWNYVRRNRDAAVDILVAEYPNLNRADERLGLEVALNYSFNADTAANGWGYMDPRIWQEQIATFNELGQFSKGAPKVDDVMTLDILTATRDARLQAINAK